MDDLSGLDWNSKSADKPPLNSYTTHLPLRPSPSPSNSGRSTPLFSQVSGSRAASGQQPVKPSNDDSFSSLLAPKPAKPAGSLSLLEKQRQLQGQGNQHRISGQQQQQQDPYNAGDSQFWEGLGSGRGTPASAEQKPNSTLSYDLLSSFSSPAPVNSVPGTAPPVKSFSGNNRFNGKQNVNDSGAPRVETKGDPTLEDDDDPFGLGQMLPQPKVTSTGAPTIDEDDILGDLSKPVSDVAAKRQIKSEQDNRAAGHQTETPMDKALAELIEMGFPVERARYALAKTESGRDVQAAVSVLINEAHSMSSTKAKARSAHDDRESEGGRQPRQRPIVKADAADAPPWLNGTSRSQTRNNPSVVDSEEKEKEFAQFATDISTSVWKSANTLWKTGQKKVAKAVADLQQDSESNQPKWMRDAQLEETAQDAPKGKSRASTSDFTTEAAMLNPEQQKLPTKPQQQQRRPSDPRARSSPSTRRNSRPLPSPVNPNARSHPRPLSARTDSTHKPSPRVNRQTIEDETAHAYVSPARRKKQSPQPPSQPKAPAETLDIFSSDAMAQPIPASKPASAPPQSSSISPRPKTHTEASRKTPPVPSSTLETSHRHRQAGTEAFRRGDYVNAHSSYTAALNGLPGAHPLTIVIRSNRAITSIKSGDAKSALADAEAALQTIGPSNGEGENIALASDEDNKSMREFYGKALMRKAEALEHMEKYRDAAKAWRDAVQVGIGGAVSIQGRNRCEKAFGTGTATPTNSSVSRAPASVRPKPASKPMIKPSAVRDLGGPGLGEAEAVKRLRATEAAAVAASDEAFALTDAVEARIASWKGGKADNLRALLGSLDTILWADAGWNKVGMSDLVLPQRVKIIYMKAIAKVHPDKIPQSASTEQKMISASVFAALNEAWDKFKKDNGL